MTLGRHSKVGNNVQIDAIIGNFTSIGEDIYVHHGDNHAVVANPKLVSTFSFGGWVDPYPGDGITKGDVVIGNDVWIGRNVKILTGVTIGDGAIIGAHSVVAKNIPPYAIAVGNPCTVKKYRFTEEQIEKLLKIKWWEWDDEKIKEALPEMKDIDTFIQKYG